MQLENIQQGKKPSHLKHNNVLCSSLGRDNGRCCGSCLQTSALLPERKGKMLPLQQEKVPGKRCEDWRAGRCEIWHCCPWKGEIRATPFVGRAASVDNPKFQLSFNVQRQGRAAGGALWDGLEGICVFYILRLIPCLRGCHGKDPTLGN